MPPLAPATVSSYLHQARPFADACAGQLGVLTAARVTGLATEGAGGLRTRSAQGQTRITVPAAVAFATAPARAARARHARRLVLLGIMAFVGPGMAVRVIEVEGRCP